MQTTDLQQARKYAAMMVCQRCWQPLIATPVMGSFGRLVDVHCTHCGQGEAFVTRRYAEEQRKQNLVERMEAQANLEDALGLRTPKPADKILTELGY